MPRPFAVSRSEEFVYVLADNLGDPEPEQVKFRCRTLTGRERDEVNDAMGDGVTLKDAASPDALKVTAIRRAARRACEFALVGWENLTAPDGKAVKFPGAGARVAELLSTLVREEIGVEVIRRSRLTEASQGN